MSGNGWLQIGVFFLVILAITKPLGVFLARVYGREKTFLDPVARPVERFLYRLSGVDESSEMSWSDYARAMLLFSAVSMVLLYLLERLQSFLPFNPENLGPVPPALAFNTAASFTSNTNWQAYVPETTMSYFTQMAGLAYQNFASAGAGMAVAMALLRGIARRKEATVGNFWVDLTRGLLWVLLPVSLVMALAFVSQGVIQNLSSYLEVETLDPREGPQTIAQGPAASQLAIKMFGTNGGGFLNANSAHPYENPTPRTNFLQLVLIFAIPSALTATLGRMTGSPGHGWAVLGAMVFLCLAGVSAAYWAESRGNPLLAEVEQNSSGNMEGKETRFGIALSALFATVTTDASCGAVNSLHDSYTPLGGMVPLVNILLGEVVFGGVGAGLYGILVFVVLSVFIAGLMVGRTPEYLGKKIEAYEVKMAVLSILVFPLSVLVLAAMAATTSLGAASISNPGPHGLSQILYAYASGAGGNGSAFAGFNANTPWLNVTIGVAMLFGRFFAIIPILAMAGSLARKKAVPPSSGTFPVTTPLFSALLVFTIVIVGALTFFPVLSLGPVLEYLLMRSGRTF